ncbi:hypothetical protein AcW1_000831 [Taiwanofungus camphoratus]|nr:hypothetical protein AcV7_000850 [Antrodia cinnamomea]KAI0963874.1 hypothetical protein AcW1_000831 [Antrodia cinnamomea]
METAEYSPRRKLVGQPLLYAISVFASLGVFLFGYDQGVMSGVITGPHFRKYFNNPGPIQVGTMVAVLEIGAFITSVAAGRVGDIIGRRGTLFIGAIVFAVGGAVQTFTPGFWVMVVGRVIAGFGVGLLSTIVPIYQSEISPPDHRGALACMEFTGNIFGYASSVWIDYSCSFIDSDLAWRIPLFIQCIIGAILAGGSLLMPESPRWLIDTDKDTEGMRVLIDLHGGDPNDVVANAEYQEIKDRVMFERESGEGRTYAMMWRKYKRRVLLAMSSQAFAQLMAIALAFTGWWMSIDVPETPRAVVACVIIFNAAFGYSWGPLPWLYPPEIMPLTVRAKGVSISTATNWAFNFLVGEITPYLQEHIEWRLYPMHGFFCVCSFILVYFLYPETRGVPLEEMDAVFGEEELEERLEDESERASLVSRRSSRSRRSGHVRAKSNPQDRGLLSRLFGRSGARASYEPIHDGDE